MMLKHMSFCRRSLLSKLTLLKHDKTNGEAQASPFLSMQLVKNLQIYVSAVQKLLQEQVIRHYAVAFSAKALSPLVENVEAVSIISTDVDCMAAKRYTIWPQDIIIEIAFVPAFINHESSLQEVIFVD